MRYKKSQWKPKVHRKLEHPAYVHSSHDEAAANWSAGPPTNTPTLQRMNDISATWQPFRHRPWPRRALGGPTVYALLDQAQCIGRAGPNLARKGEWPPANKRPSMHARIKEQQARTGLDHRLCRRWVQSGCLPRRWPSIYRAQRPRARRASTRSRQRGGCLDE